MGKTMIAGSKKLVKFRTPAKMSTVIWGYMNRIQYMKRSLFLVRSSWTSQVHRLIGLCQLSFLVFPPTRTPERTSLYMKNWSYMEWTKQPACCFKIKGTDGEFKRVFYRSQRSHISSEFELKMIYHWAYTTNLPLRRSEVSDMLV